MYQQMLHVIAIGDWLTSHSWRWWTLHHHRSSELRLTVRPERSSLSRFCNSLCSRSILISGLLLLESLLSYPITCQYVRHSRFLIDI